MKELSQELAAETSIEQKLAEVFVDVRLRELLGDDSAIAPGNLDILKQWSENLELELSLIDNWPDSDDGYLKSVRLLAEQDLIITQGDTREIRRSFKEIDDVEFGRLVYCKLRQIICSAQQASGSLSA